MDRQEKIHVYSSLSLGCLSYMTLIKPPFCKKVNLSRSHTKIKQDEVLQRAAKAASGVQHMDIQVSTRTYLHCRELKGLQQEKNRARLSSQMHSKKIKGSQDAAKEIPH